MRQGLRPGGRSRGRLLCQIGSLRREVDCAERQCRLAGRAQDVYLETADGVRRLIPLGFRRSRVPTSCPRSMNGLLSADKLATGLCTGSKVSCCHGRDTSRKPTRPRFAGPR